MTKFQVGDRVEAINLGTGTVIFIETEEDDDELQLLIEFDKENTRFHSGNGMGREHRCYWLGMDSALLSIVEYHDKDGVIYD